MQCLHEFAEKFEELFKTRAHAIDHMEGFINMWVLKSENNPLEYIVLPYGNRKNTSKIGYIHPNFWKVINGDSLLWPISLKNRLSAQSKNIK